MARTPLILFLLAVSAFSPVMQVSGDEPRSKGPGQLEPCELGAIRKLHRIDDLYLAGQPSADDLRLVAKQGIKTVINLRTAEELAFDEKAVLKELKLEYHHIPFRAPETLTDKVFDETRKLLRSDKSRPVLLHCASANRVGAVWLAVRVLDDHVEWERALLEAKMIGLATPAYEQKAREYIERQRAAESRNADPVAVPRARP